MKDDDKNIGNPERDNDSNGDEWMMNVDTHLHTSEWFGGLFFFVLNVGKKKWKEIFKSENRKRNIRVGYFVQLVAFTLLCYLLYTFFVLPG